MSGVNLSTITTVMTNLQPILNFALPLAMTWIVLTFIKNMYNK